MKTAILCWGSLFWDPRNLQYIGPWKKTELAIPIEFSRVSKDGRLTLVIDFDHGVNTFVYAAESSFSNIDSTVENLRKREGTAIWQIGFYDAVTEACSHGNGKSDERNHKNIAKIVKHWLESDGVEYDSAVWTALPSNFQDITGLGFSEENAVNYISELEEEKVDSVINYITRAPELVVTPAREAIGLWLKNDKNERRLAQQIRKCDSERFSPTQW